MKLQFDIARIPELAEQYLAESTDEERRLEEKIFPQMFTSYRENGHLTKEQFLAVCRWKTPRSQKWCSQNGADLVEEVSRLALKTRSEQIRIEIWLILAGVQWPTASVFLHFAFPQRYPILDFRALDALGTEVPSQYTFAFWWKYTNFCQELAQQAGVSMRVLDRALWIYSASRLR